MPNNVEDISHDCIPSDLLATTLKQSLTHDVAHGNTLGNSTLLYTHREALERLRRSLEAMRHGFELLSSDETENLNVSGQYVDSVTGCWVCVGCFGMEVKNEQL